MNVTIGEPPIASSAEFHSQIALALEFPHYYGKNLNALWDVLRIDTERPTRLIWLNSKASASFMRGEFDEIVQLLRDVATHDREHGLPEFELVLE
jgi:ribonuclease inhibitor